MKTPLVAGLVLAALSSATALASADAAPAAHHRAVHGYVVTAKVNKTDPMVHDTIRIRASVTPAAPGATVTLQLKYDDQKAWKTVRHAKLDNKSSVIFRDKVDTVRVRKYRVVKAADAKGSVGHGDTAKVSVFGWRTLSSVPVATNNGFNSQSSLTININGTAYPSSIGTSGYGVQPFHIDYNLNRDCRSLQGRFGLNDSSPAAGRATMALVADGTTKYLGDFGLTQSAPVDADVTGVFRITISAATTAGGLGAVGSPRVLCSF